MNNITGFKSDINVGISRQIQGGQGSLFAFATVQVCLYTGNMHVRIGIVEIPRPLFTVDFNTYLAIRTGFGCGHLALHPV